MAIKTGANYDSIIFTIHKGGISMINGIHHVAISTPDLKATVKFFTEALGGKLVMESEWPQGSEMLDKVIGLKDSAAQMAMLRINNAHIEVFEFSSPEPRPGDPNRPVCDHGYTHLCLEVKDIDAEVERLEKHGMTFFAKPPSAEELGMDMRAIYGRIPDGNIIELMEIMPECSLPIRL
jgi:catechol 2,3-dioxygenase-like lactoylglutathione lyase family enzyme